MIAVAETFDPAAILGLPEPARRWLGAEITGAEFS
jgi:hypothetical protein